MALPSQTGSRSCAPASARRVRNAASARNEWAGRRGWYTGSPGTAATGERMPDTGHFTGIGTLAATSARCAHDGAASHAAPGTIAPSGTDMGTAARGWPRPCEPLHAGLRPGAPDWPEQGRPTVHRRSVAGHGTNCAARHGLARAHARRGPWPHERDRCRPPSGMDEGPGAVSVGRWTGLPLLAAYRRLGIGTLAADHRRACALLLPSRQELGPCSRTVTAPSQELWDS